MANTTLKALTAISGTTLDNADLFLTHDFSANTEYKISLTDLRTAVGNVGTGSFTVTSSGTSDALVVTSTDAGAGDAPDFVLYRNSASPAVNDIIGNIRFRGKNSAGSNKEYGAIYSGIVSPTNGSESSFMIFNTTQAGTLTERLRINEYGNIGIGSIGTASETLRITKSLTGATSVHGIRNDGAIQTDVTAQVFMYRTAPSAVASATLTTLNHYAAAQGTFGTGATVTNQVGYLVEASLIGATKNVGFQVNAIAAASVTTGKTVRVMESGQNTASGGGTAHNLYIAGTAPSYFAGSVGFGIDTPNAAAKVQIDSTTQGFLPPRMTTTQRGAISSPPAGLIIYNSTTNKLNFYNGTAWEAVTSA